MNHKFLIIAATTAALSYAQIACSQGSAQPIAQKPATAEQAAEQTPQQQADAAAAKATAEVQSVVTVTEPTPAQATVAPEAVTATAEVEALKSVFIERRRLNYSKVELDFAKEKAQHKNAELLQQKSDALYSAAVQNLSSVLGGVSEPQAEETYFEYDMNEETKEFVIIQIRDSYIKAERGDVCQVSTRVHLITSLAKELPSEVAPVVVAAPQTPENPAGEGTVVVAVAVDPSAPVTESYTEIRCFNDKRTTYHQLLLQ